MAAMTTLTSGLVPGHRYSTWVAGYVNTRSSLEGGDMVARRFPSACNYKTFVSANPETSRTTPSARGPKSRIQQARQGLFSLRLRPSESYSLSGVANNAYNPTRIAKGATLKML